MGITDGLALSWGSRVGLCVVASEQSRSTIDITSDVVGWVSRDGECTLTLGVVNRESDVTTTHRGRVTGTSGSTSRGWDSGSKGALSTTVTG